MAPRVSLPSAIRGPRTLINMCRRQFTQKPASAAERSGLKSVRQTPNSALLGVGDTTEGPRGSAAALWSTYNSQRSERPPEAREVYRDLDSRNRGEEFARQMPRRWKEGDVYTPRDLGPGEMQKYKKYRPPRADAVDQLGLNPLDMYRNFSVISEYMTPHGRIRKRADTGLRMVNQRKIAKMVRRAIGLGLHPSVHKHPELIMLTQGVKKDEMLSRKSSNLYP